MQMRHLFFVTGIAALLAGIWLLHRSEEDRILAQLEEIRALAEVQAPESTIEMLVRARQLAGYFTAQTRFDLGRHGIREVPSSEELVQRIARIRLKLASLELALQDMQVDIEEDQALVVLRGTGQGTIRGEDGRFLEIHTAEIKLVKTDGAWLIAGGNHIRDERQPPE